MRANENNFETSSSEGGDFFYSNPSGFTHRFYLQGEIKDGSNYVRWCETIRSAGETDEIIIFINSEGGYLWSALQIVNAIRESAARVTAVIDGICMSAATMIFLAADSYRIMPNSMFMAHNYSSHKAGKGGELYDGILYEREWSEQLWKSVYEGFLEPDEISNLLRGQDIWLNSQQVFDRLESRYEYFKTQKKDEEIQVSENITTQLDLPKENDSAEDLQKRVAELEEMMKKLTRINIINTATFGNLANTTTKADDTLRKLPSE